MTQRTNRAYYSESLISFPGRLHVTAERICVEVILSEGGRRSIRSFTPEEFDELKKSLVEQVFYKEGYEEAYDRELFDVHNRAIYIQNFLFKSVATSKGFTDNEIEEHYQESEAPLDENTYISTEIAVDPVSDKDQEPIGISSDALDNDLPVNAIVEQPLFEQSENNETLVSDVSEKQLSALTSKYIGKFANLHTAKKKNGRYAPDKAVLLMSVLSLYDGGRHHGATIFCNSSLKEDFKAKWAKYQPDSNPPALKPIFLNMSEESFWHLDPSMSGQDLSAQIDPGLEMIMNQRNSRSLLRKTLFNRYLK